MSRLTQSDLEDLVARLRRVTNEDYVLDKWNEYYHVYNRDTQEMIITAKMRGCYDYLQAYLAGISYAIDHMGASMFSK